MEHARSCSRPCEMEGDGGSESIDVDRTRGLGCTRRRWMETGSFMREENGIGMGIQHTKRGIRPEYDRNEFNMPSLPCYGFPPFQCHLSAYSSHGNEVVLNRKARQSCGFKALRSEFCQRPHGCLHAYQRSFPGGQYEHG
eukprot:760477-Hanusia_phi.AAC.4